MRGKIVLLGAAAALLLSLGAGTARADHRDCWKKINKAEDKLRDAVRNHGWNSRKAQERRANLNRVRAQCGGFGWNRGRDDNWWNRGRDDNGWNRGRDHNWRRGNDWRDNDRRDNDRRRHNWNRNRDRDRDHDRDRDRDRDRDWNRRRP